jgi:very-short-patch-repair endonuclease
MSDELVSPDMSLALDAPQNIALVSEWLLGTSALLMQHQGATKIAELIADVTLLEIRLWNTQWGNEGYLVTLVVEPSLLPRYDQEALKSIGEAMMMVLRPAGKDLDEIRVRPEIPRIAAGWRGQVKTANGPKPTNQARKPRLEPRQWVEDQLHFTNQYELELYQVLKKKQAALPDNETIGIMPLGGMRVRRRVVEPDFLITYRGRAAAIELDGPHHRDRASADHSRDRQLRHAGLAFVERLNVEEVNTLAEVEKFVDDFLAQFGR